jgi:hypothetical protein
MKKEKKRLDMFPSFFSVMKYYFIVEMMEMWETISRKKEEKKCFDASSFLFLYYTCRSL